MEIKSFGTQKEQVVELKPKKPCQLLDISVDYDTTKPVETLKTFIQNINEMINRYQGNQIRIAQIENELCDLEHYIEIGSGYKRVPDGYKIYKKMTELRRERRACKNEMDLLWPVYEYFHATEVLGRLRKLQGDCNKVQKAVDERVYVVRTDSLKEWIEPEPPAGDMDGDVSLVIGCNQPDISNSLKKYSKVWEAEKCTEAK